MRYVVERVLNSIPQTSLLTTVPSRLTPTSHASKKLFGERIIHACGPSNESTIRKMSFGVILVLAMSGGRRWVTSCVGLSEHLKCLDRREIGKD